MKNSKQAEEKIDLAKKSFDEGDSEKGNKYLKEAKAIFYQKKEKEKAAKMYEDFGQFTLAGEIWKEVGKPEKIKNLEKKKKKEIKEIRKEKTEETFVRRTSLILGILSFSLSTFLFSKSMTGNVIDETLTPSYNLLGLGLFIFALVMFSVFIKKKKMGRIYKRR